jgi:hypothetical protein
VKVNDDTPEFVAWMERVKRCSEEFRMLHYPGAAPDIYRVDVGRRYMRVVIGTAAHSFVDRETGDVLRPASWAGPAKHARGNIFDADMGMGWMGPYGPASMR